MIKEIVRFNKHNVVNTETKNKARVFYSLDNRVDGRKCVTLYAKDVLEKLGKVFENTQTKVKNDSDSMTDYFESDKVVLFEDSPFYESARKRAKENEAAKDNLELITTEKDFHRIKKLGFTNIKYLPINTIIHEEEKLLNQIKFYLKNENN